MINFRSSSLALALSLAGLTLSTQTFALSAEPVISVKKIKIKADDGDNATLVANINGENIRVELPKQALQDKVALETALSGLPQEVRDTLATALSDIEFGEHKLKVKHLSIESKASDDGDVRLHLEGDAGEERVIVVDIDEAGQELNHHKFVESIEGLDGNKIIKIISDGHQRVGKDTIIRLLSAAKLTTQELNDIQQALDNKR